jgi:hypothetical protein
MVSATVERKRSTHGRAVCNEFACQVVNAADPSAGLDPHAAAVVKMSYLTIERRSPDEHCRLDHRRYRGDPGARPLAWMVLNASMVRIPSGSLGLLMVNGRATDTALLPGPHFFLPFAERWSSSTPSVELSYRARAPQSTDDPGLQQSRQLVILVALSKLVGQVAMPTLAAVLIYAAIGSFKPAEIRSVLRTGLTSQIAL